MNYLPSQELIDVLEPAYAPCSGFSDKCRGVARWCPAAGHFPRGFIGAFGDLDEVKVVIVVAEPGDPFSVRPVGARCFATRTIGANMQSHLRKLWRG